MSIGCQRLVGFILKDVDCKLSACLTLVNWTKHLPNSCPVIAHINYAIFYLAYFEKLINEILNIFLYNKCYGNQHVKH